GYDEAETAKKIASRIKFPPTTCEQFRRTNPEGCKGCMQRCHSPISLGHPRLEPLAAMQQQYGMVNIGKICVYNKKFLDS
ncbi:hypothetical protein JZU69_01935, partial [bacterium]|nr:hypothetical protein [bacterium]